MSEEPQIAWSLVVWSIIPFVFFTGMFGYALSKKFKAVDPLIKRRWLVVSLIGIAGWIVWTILFTWMLVDFASFPLNR